MELPSPGVIREKLDRAADRRVRHDRLAVGCRVEIRIAAEVPKSASEAVTEEPIAVRARIDGTQTQIQERRCRQKVTIDVCIEVIAAELILAGHYLIGEVLLLERSGEIQ